jgi:hypothetical protein
MAAHSLDEAVEIDRAVAKALGEAGVSEGSGIRLSLVHDAEVHDGAVVVPDPDGKSVTLRQRLDGMRTESRWRSDFPAEKKPAPGRPAPTPAGAMLTPDREAFAKIVAGETVVR